VSARIGVVGPNGMGRSTALWIVVGLERPTNGDAFPSPGISVGILEQEPRLDVDTTVQGNVEHGVAEVRGMLRRYEEVTARLGEADGEEMQRLLDELRVVPTVGRTPVKELVASPYRPNRTGRR